MQKWVAGYELPDAVETGALRSTARFVRRNRLQLIVAGIATAVVGVTAVAAAGAVPRVDAVATQASAVDDFPTELFRGPLGLFRGPLGEGDTGSGEVAETLPGKVDVAPPPDAGGSAPPAPAGPRYPGDETPEPPTPPVGDEEPPLGAEALEFSVRLTPDVIEAGVYTADVTINVDGIAPVQQSVSLTFTESIDLLARATEQCQAMLDSWGGFPGVVIDDGETVATYHVESSVGVDIDPDFEPGEPPTLEECLSWYGY